MKDSVQLRVVVFASTVAVGTLPMLISVASGEVNLSAMHDYTNQPVPAYINTTPGVFKDNTNGNTMTDAGATLGRVLFYDTRLSTTGTVSCATCHQQEHAFGDLPALSQGANGPTTRHSTRLVNTRWGAERRFGWDKGADTLEHQMTRPIRNQAEMGFSGANGFPSFDGLLTELNAVDEYRVLFERVFGDPVVTEERMQLAMAQFVRSIQSFDSKYDQGRAQVANDRMNFPNFTQAENAGKRLFTQNFQFVPDTLTTPDGTFAVSRRTAGGFNCATCHQPPEFDIDPVSRNNGRITPSPPGEGNPFDFTVTRSPSLRDLVNSSGELNGGMFHDGLAGTLDEMIDHYDFTPREQTNPNLDRRMTPGGLPQFLNATAQERAQIAAFLLTLSGSDIYTNEKWSDPFNQDGSMELSGITDIGPCDSAAYLYMFAHGDDMTDVAAPLGAHDMFDALQFLSDFSQGCAE